MAILSDKKFFATILYFAFVNHEFLTSDYRDIWKNSWVTEIAEAAALGLVGWVIITTISYGLGIGTEASLFIRWFTPLYEGTIKCGSLTLILQSIEAAGLRTITKAFGAALRELIKAVCDHKFEDYLN